MPHRFKSIAFLLCLAVLLLATPSAPARQVDVTWQMQADETLEQGKQRATKTGWTEAALLEAREILPGELSPERSELLREFLESRAGRLVRNSRETSLSESVDGMHLGLDVEISVPALRQLLQRAGVFYTVAQTLPCTLTLENPPEGATQEIERLETLSGLRQEPGSGPHLTLTHSDGEWQGVIEAGGSRYDIAGSDLATVWFSLLGWYFTVQGPQAAQAGDGGQAAGASQAELVVEGWPSPDGVYAFEHVLEGFRPALAEATLSTLTMRPEGIAGVWKVALRDVAGFQQRLDAYMQGRELVWRLEGLAQKSPLEAPGAESSNPDSQPGPKVEATAQPGQQDGPHASPDPQAPPLTTRPWQGSTPVSTPESPGQETQTKTPQGGH